MKKENIRFINSEGTFKYGYTVITKEGLINFFSNKKYHPGKKLKEGNIDGVVREVL